MKKRLKYVLQVVKDILSHQDHGQIWESPPIFALKDRNGPKIHLGPGNINLQGWINIDALNLSHIHIVDSELLLNEFLDGTVSIFYLCHVLEHFSMREGEMLLKRIYKKLNSGGEVLMVKQDH